MEQAVKGGGAAAACPREHSFEGWPRRLLGRESDCPRAYSSNAPLARARGGVEGGHRRRTAGNNAAYIPSTRVLVETRVNCPQVL